TNVDHDTRQEFASIKAEPVVEFDRLRYLLLIWPNEDRQHKLLKSHANDRLEQEQEVTNGQ
ncbi:hypothetical protein OFN60_39660, partial [Escherichia coli]|nr:hypothetical protein [Escherichia coli]